MTEQDIRRYLRLMKEEDSETAFRDFFNLTYDRLFRIAYHYVKRDDWAQEVMLDAYMSLWNHRSTLLEVSNLENYLFTTTKKKALTFLENEQRYLGITDDSVSTTTEDTSESPEEVFISEELFARYVKALDRLPARCREVFVRLREQGQSYAEVAEAMGISEKTVDAQLQNALTRLREMLT
ncbi:MAG: RNA polymerase sigma-70 factor [Bacteroidaceae bacterium]|nr:RNA polymerase sigma-70 factor [Bacteroidaceae bacterium]